MNFQEQRRKLEYNTNDLEIYNETVNDLDYDFGRKHDLPALHQWGDGFEQGEATKEELEELVKRGLIERDESGYNESGYDFGNLDELYLKELEHALEKAKEEKINAIALECVRLMVEAAGPDPTTDGESFMPTEPLEGDFNYFDDQMPHAHEDDRVEFERAYNYYADYARAILENFGFQYSEYIKLAKDYDYTTEYTPEDVYDAAYNFRSQFNTDDFTPTQLIEWILETS